MTDVTIPTIAAEIAGAKQRTSALELAPNRPVLSGEWWLTAPSKEEVATGDTTSPYPILAPVQVVDAFVVIASDIGDPVEFSLRRGGNGFATVTVAAGEVFSPRVPVNKALGGAGWEILDIECTDDGGGGYGGFCVALLMR